MVMTDASTTYRTVVVDELAIFYREAGPRDAPAILLLHGFPSSSTMFATLIPRLADHYHLVAPDYPGFGLSDAPPTDRYDYTFDQIAKTMGRFAEQLGLTRYTLFMQDYGGPVGMRLAIAHPERVDALIVQNAVHSEQGLGPAWASRRLFWQDRAVHETAVIDAFLSLETTRARHVGTSPHPERYDPAEWLAEYAHLSKPGQREIQSNLFYDYRTNVASYPAWQRWLRQHQPPTLVLWGRYDPSFAVDGAAAWQQDVPAASVHILDAGHFALDEQVDMAAALIRTRAATGRSSASHGSPAYDPAVPANHSRNHPSFGRVSGRTKPNPGGSASAARHEPGRIGCHAVSADGAGRRLDRAGCDPARREPELPRQDHSNRSERRRNACSHCRLDRLLRLSTRPVSVPVDALVLLGDVVEVVAFTPAQLRQLPEFVSRSSTSLASDATIKIGLAKPSH